MLNGSTIRYIRPIERPVGRVTDPTDKELVPDVFRGIEVSILKMSALTAPELALAPSVTSIGEPAGVAALAGMPWINTDHHAPDSLSLVGQELPELGEGPRVQTAFGISPASLDSLPDVGQILDNDSRAGRNAFQNVFAQYVIAIPSEPLFTAREASKVALGRLRAIGLQFALQAEASLADFAPAAFAMEAVIACHGGAADPKINPDGLAVRGKLNIRQIDDYVQPELSISADQISGSGLAPVQWQRVIGDSEGDLLATSDRSYICSPRFPVNAIGMTVKAWRAEIRNWAGYFLPFLLQSQRRFYTLRRFLDRLNVVVGNQMRSNNLAVSICQFVKVKGIAFHQSPTDRANVVERLRELKHSVHQAFGLRCSRLKAQLDCSLHQVNITIREYDYASLTGAGNNNG